MTNRNIINPLKKADISDDGAHSVKVTEYETEHTLGNDAGSHSANINHGMHKNSL